MKNLLIVVDMQNDFVSGVLGTKEAQEIVPNVLKAIESFDGIVIATKDTHKSNYLDTQEGKNLPVEHCIIGTDGINLVPDVLAKLQTEDYSYFTKNAFASLDLAKHIGETAKEIKSVTLIGVCTDVCIISNAMLIKAFAPEVEIIVDASCCAGVTPESHRIALQAMKACQITIINEDVIDEDVMPKNFWSDPEFRNIDEEAIDN